MDTTAFLETMVDTLKFDGNFKDKREKLLPILRRAKLNSIPQYQFAYRSGQHYEDVEIRVPVPLIDEANSLQNELNSLVKYVYEETEVNELGAITESSGDISRKYLNDISYLDRSTTFTSDKS